MQLRFNVIIIDFDICSVKVIRRRATLSPLNRWMTLIARRVDNVYFNC